MTVIVIVLTATAASHVAGLPHDAQGRPAALPDIALGWRLLFHVERAAILLGTAGAVVLVAWRALRGEFPIKFGQVEYSVREAVGAAADVAESQERRLRYLEVAAGIRDPEDIET